MIGELHEDLMADLATAWISALRIAQEVKSPEGRDLAREIIRRIATLEGLGENLKAELEAKDDRQRLG